MRAIGRFLVLATVSALLSACGGSGNGKSQHLQIPDPPAAPGVSVEGDIKQLIFSWVNVANTDYYRLLENADGHSGFTQVGADIPMGTLSATRDIAVHRHDWINALYIVQACNRGGCTGSAEVSATDVMLDTIGYFKASNTEAGDYFGAAVAISADGNTLAVGARREDSSATGTNGDQADNSADGAGAVYLFRFDGTSWAQQAYIKASNTEAGDLFGSMQALSPGMSFSGSPIALSADGDTLAVGAPGEDSSATGINGDQADNSAHYAGAVYLFRFDGTSWAQQAYVKASNTEAGDYFGHAVALSADGDTLAVGAHGWHSRGVYLFRSDGTSWAQQAYINGLAYFGWAIALSADGDTLAVGDVGAASVYVFRFDGTSWAQQAYIRGFEAGAVEDCFGDTVALSADGNTLAASGCEDGRVETSLGAVYLFRYDGASWARQANIKARDMDNFGTAVALSADGNTLAAGARREESSATGINGDQDDDSAENAGAVYLFHFDGTSWAQKAYIKASNTEGWDYFGYAVALSADGNTLAVGAHREDSSAAGINGDEADNSADDAGAVYVY